MTKLHGFELVWQRQVPELQSRASLWRHNQSGASLLSFCNSDENKVFGATFRTPPANSTGVAHILEHSVLNGSKKYPSKEPFVELLKGSLQTFLNAFTYPDKTCYPVASANLQDFYNLVDVYLDAVFHPLLAQSTFEQEGWHVEATDPDAALLFKGVVYNEMKGVYSSPDSVLAESSQQSIFPDITYGLDSGGRPQEILRLTYEDFCAFHATFYHPSNTRFFFWGDDPEEKRLEILNTVLCEFDSLTLNSEVKLQEPFKQPRLIEVPYAVDAEEDADQGARGGQAMMTMNWLLPETSGVIENFAFQMLDHILTGLPGSPLRRALIESGLGEDITGGGLENELRQMYYSIGLRGVKEEDIPAVEVLIMDTLAALTEEGLSPETVEAAMNSVEFSLRENNTGRFPVGLAIMLRSLTTWLYDDDPLALVAFEKPLQELKAKVAAKEPVFEKLIQKYFLHNQHRSTVALLPDAKLAEQQRLFEEESLAALKDSLDHDELQKVIARTEELKAIQEAPEDPAALRAIPRLTVADMPKENKSIERQELSCKDTPLFFHPQPTAGIVYADLIFNSAGLDPALTPLLPLFGRAMLEMGTARRSFVDLGLHIAAKTGGLDADPMFLTTWQQRGTLPAFVLSGKATAEKLGALVEIFEEVLLEGEFDDAQRFGQMVLEEKARQEQMLIPQGHSVVALRLQAGLCLAGSLSEQTGGIAYLDYLRELVQRVESSWPSVLADLLRVREQIISRKGLLLNLTARAEDKGRCEKAFASLLDKLSVDNVSKASNNSAQLSPLTLLSSSDLKPERSKTSGEAFLLPAQVNYIGQGLNLYDQGYTYHGSLQVILKYLRTGFLWEEIRVKGGAYGAISSFDRLAGTLCLVSYRDPNVERTLEVYGRIGEHLAQLKLDPVELESSIIGAVGELDAYLLPDAKGFASAVRALCNDSPETRQRMREQILATSLKDFNLFGEWLQSVKHKQICLLGGSEVEKFAKQKGLPSRRV